MHGCMYVCACVRVCVCACVREYDKRALTYAKSKLTGPKARRQL